jgi:hypothetical protein
MRSGVTVIFFSDVHLSDRAPLARAEKGEWQHIQFGYLYQIRSIWNECGKPTVVIAGDVFDKWKISPETVNNAIECFKDFEGQVWAIPGQHDLPFHNYKDINKSSFWTLVKSGAVKNIPANSCVSLSYISPNDPRLHLWGFPWGHEPTPKPDLEVKGRHVAVAHKYIWKEGFGYPGAPAEAHVATETIMNCRRAYDAMFFGDNHSAWNRQNVWNCGNLINRKSDERLNQPSVYLLGKDGIVKRVELDISKDKWVEESALKELKEENKNLEGFLETLGSMEDVVLDFAEAVRRYFDQHKVGKGVRKLILEALEG